MSEPLRRRPRDEREDAPPRGRRSDARESAGGIFRHGFESLTALALSGVQVTASVLDLESGRVLFSVDDHLSVPTAGVGQVLLLVEVAARISERDQPARGASPDDTAGGRPGLRAVPGAESLSILNRTAGDRVGGSGLWQHLQVPALPIADLAALVGATNDNLATNVLLRRIGLDGVRARGEQLGLRRTHLLDIVRDERGPDDAPQLSVGSARELSSLFRRIHRGEAADEMASKLVVGWLSLGSDLSMVASAFGFDPLAHDDFSHGLTLFNKTGSDHGIRSEVGVLTGPRAGVAYAVTMRFNDRDLPARLAVLDGMRTLGTDLLEYVY